MRAAVLAPGPSLLASYVSGADLTVGVNRTAAAFPVDVFACLDLPLALDLWLAVPAPAWLTLSATAASVERRGLSSREVVTVESLDGFCPVPNWRIYTAPAAVVYAAWRGATEIRIFGMDWAGQRDWDGARAGENRSESRWERERAIWRDVAGWLAARRVTVTKH